MRSDVTPETSHSLPAPRAVVYNRTLNQPNVTFRTTEFLRSISRADLSSHNGQFVLRLFCLLGTVHGMFQSTINLVVSQHDDSNRTSLSLRRLSLPSLYLSLLSLRGPEPGFATFRDHLVYILSWLSLSRLFRHSPPGLLFSGSIRPDLRINPALRNFSFFPFCSAGSSTRYQDVSHIESVRQHGILWPLGGRSSSLIPAGQKVGSEASRAW